MKETKPSRGLVDCHTHRYPPEVFADPTGWARARGENHWAQLVGPRADGRRSLQGWADRDQMLRAMDEAGVERCVLLGWYWERQETCAWHNEWMARWVREDPDRFSAFASVQPRAGAAIRCFCTILSPACITFLLTEWRGSAAISLCRSPPAR